MTRQERRNNLYGQVHYSTPGAWSLHQLSAGESNASRGRAARAWAWLQAVGRLAAPRWEGRRPAERNG